MKTENRVNSEQLLAEWRLLWLRAGDGVDMFSGGHDMLLRAW